MLFKQIQLFRLEKFQCSAQQLEEKLACLSFQPCLPSLPSTSGWVSPIQEEGSSLVQELNGCFMICFQTEEKILPSIIIRQALEEKIKVIEAREGRRVRSKEKVSLKEDLTQSLLPKAFSKLTRTYAYIDTKNQWLVVGTTNTNRVEQLFSLLKKSFSGIVSPIDTKKLSPLLTRWLKYQDFPSTFSIGKACILRGVDQKNRTIRCQQQDLFASSIQTLLQDGCAVNQVALCWQDRVNFLLATDQFSLNSIQYQESLIADNQDHPLETQQEQFSANFFIMTETLSALFKDLMLAMDLFQNSLQRRNLEEHQNIEVQAV